MIHPGRVRWLAALLLLTAVCSAIRADEETEDRKGSFVRVADASSIVVRRFNREYIFDLLGVTAVIIVDPKGSEGFSDLQERVAKVYLTAFLKDQRLVMRLEESRPGWSGPRSYSGYVYSEDGTCLNEEVLRRGYARVDETVSFTRRAAFDALQEEARAGGRGLWKRPETLTATPPQIPCPEGEILYAGLCGVGNPTIIPESKVVPEYPGRARRKKIEGRVILQAVVTKEGAVGHVEVLVSPDDLLTNAALDAVEQWRYHPALKDGRPVDAYFTIVVDFLLGG